MARQPDHRTATTGNQPRLGFILGAVTVATLLAACSSTDSATSESVTPSSAASATLTQRNFTIAGESKRHDDQPTYYVVVDPVNLDSSAFKDTVKNAVETLAADNGNPDFTAWIFDDLEIAKTAYAEADAPIDLTGDTNAMKAKLQAKELHLIAVYSGGNSMTQNPYEISWFPSATSDSPTVGRWYEPREQWKP
jgi:hypothetical protein